MGELGPVLERIRDRFAPEGEPLRRVMERARSRHRNRRITAGALALVVSAAAGAGLVSIFRSERRPATPEPATIPTGTPLDLAVGEGSVWVLTCDRRCDNDGRQSEGSLVRVDAATRQAVASVSVDRPHAVAVGEGGAWVISFWGGTVTRIDPVTNSVVDTIPLELPYDIVPGDRAFLPLHVATGEGAVWVSTRRGTVAKIDPATNEVASVIELQPAATGDVAAGEGAVWVGEIPGLVRIHPATGEVLTTIDLGIQPGELSVVDGAVWVVGTEVERNEGEGGYRFAGGRVLVKVDPATMAEEGRIRLPQPWGGVAVGEDVVWATDPGGNLHALDPDSGREIGEPLEGAGGILAPDGTALWVATPDGLERVTICPGGPCYEPSPPPTSGPSDEGSTCEFSRYRPTYLPWLSPGEPVPPPQKERYPAGRGPQGTDPGYSILGWYFGDITTAEGPHREGTVTLWRSTESAGAIPPDPRVPPLPTGAEGRLYEHPGGDWSISWVDPIGDACAETTLNVTLPQLTKQENLEEILKVARSLVLADELPPGPGDAFALWPEDTPEEAAEADTAGRSDPGLVAEAFARTVLEWTDPEVVLAEPGHGGAATYLVRRGDGPEVRVGLDQVFEQLWSVVSASVDLDLFNVVVTHDTIGVRFDALDAARAEVIMGFGDEEPDELAANAEIRDGIGEKGFLGFDRSRPGHVLVLFRDGEGRVFAAKGVALPADLPPGEYPR